MIYDLSPTFSNNKMKDYKWKNLMELSKYNRTLALNLGLDVVLTSNKHIYFYIDTNVTNKLIKERRIPTWHVICQFKISSNDIVCGFGYDSLWQVGMTVSFLNMHFENVYFGLRNITISYFLVLDDLRRHLSN